MGISIRGKRGLGPKTIAIQEVEGLFVHELKMFEQLVPIKI